MQDNDLGGGDVVLGREVYGAKNRKGTLIATLNFDDSDDDVFDEEAEGDKAARLTKSTIDVNTGERVACQLEKGVSTG